MEHLLCRGDPPLYIAKRRLVTYENFDQVRGLSSVSETFHKCNTYLWRNKGLDAVTELKKKSAELKKKSVEYRIKQRENRKVGNLLNKNKWVTKIKNTELWCAGI